MQYLNCKILQGDAFAALTKLQWKLCNSIPAIEWRPKKKKRKKVFFAENEVFFPPNQVKTKKKVFTAIWDYIRPEFVGFIRAGWLLIVSSSSAQISMGGCLNLDGGTLNLVGGTLTPDGGTRPPQCRRQSKRSEGALAESEGALK